MAQTYAPTIAVEYGAAKTDTGRRDARNPMMFRVMGKGHPQRYGTSQEYVTGTRMHEAGLLPHRAYMELIQAESARADAVGEEIETEWRAHVRELARAKSWVGRFGTNEPWFSAARYFSTSAYAILTPEERKLFENYGFNPAKSPNPIRYMFVGSGKRWLNRFVDAVKGKGQRSRDALRNSKNAGRILTEMSKEGEAFRAGLHELNPNGYVALYRGEPFEDPREAQIIQSYTLDPTWAALFAYGLTREDIKPVFGTVLLERIPIDRVVAGINSPEHEVLASAFS